MFLLPHYLCAFHCRGGGSTTVYYAAYTYTNIRIVYARIATIRRLTARAASSAAPSAKTAAERRRRFRRDPATPRVFCLSTAFVIRPRSVSRATSFCRRRRRLLFLSSQAQAHAAHRTHPTPPFKRNRLFSAVFLYSGPAVPVPKFVGTAVTVTCSPCHLYGEISRSIPLSNSPFPPLHPRRGTSRVPL